MKIASVAVNFGKHAEARVTLPRTGVVLVTGHNGAGKSSMIEGVAHALWDQSIRKTKMWDAGLRASKTTDLSASVSLWDEDGNASAEVARITKARGTTLTFSFPWGTEEIYENQPKAQAALEEAIGSFDVWRKTSVFSVQDVDSFTSAPDADRKRLLESILGLSKLDDAHDNALKDLREAERQLAAAKNKLSCVEYAVASCRKTVEGAQARADQAVPADSVDLAKARYEEARRVASESKLALLAAEQDAQDTDQSLVAITQRVRELTRELAAHSRSECSECGQSIANDQHKVQSIKDALDKAVEEERDARADANQAKAVLKQARVTREETSQEVSAAREALRLVEISESAYQTAASTLRDAQSALEDELDKMDEAKAEVCECERGVSVASTVAKVLSTKGVRAHILGGALGAIEEVANTWLQKIAAVDKPLELKLSVYVQKSKGGTQDALGLEVIGAGGGNGYNGSSGGERRRIDVALMLALAEVAEYAHGSTPGTLFFDEVFDGLDEDGVEAVCDVITELADTRCVLLISHDPNLLQRLRRVDVHYTFAKGRIV